MDYEQQQIQHIIQTQIKQDIETERTRLRAIQQEEYEKALKKDLLQNSQNILQECATPEPEPEPEEPSLEEVRRVRLLRFEKSKQLKQ